MNRRATLFFGAVGLISALAIPAQAQLAITKYYVVSQKRLTRTDWEYAFRVDVTNSGAAAANVTATVTSTTPHTLILEGSVTFGDVGAGATVTSSDTFTFRQDRQYLLTAEAFHWTFNFTPSNRPPIANAGTDQTAYVTDTVMLNGGASSDPDSNPLSYRWSFVSRPPGSAAALANSTLVNPSFVIDKFGVYVAQLIVNDGTVDSMPAQVTISTLNSRPVAHAGPDQTVAVATTAPLTGAGSSDVDGDPLTFSWSFASRPAGSSAALVNAASVSPHFLVDKPGAYVLRLVVNDGKIDSLPATMTVSTINSPPVANPGANQTAGVGSTVTLNGAGSIDVDGDPLTFRWSFTSWPAGSAHNLLNANTVGPSFLVDMAGQYVVQLIVNDGFVDSAPVSVTISTVNTPPVANAGPNQTVFVGDTAHLDGSASSDVDGNPLTYRWSLTTAPAGSGAVLSNPALVNPTFTVDRPGSYIAQLIVNDGTVDSAPSTVSISTLNSPPVANPGPGRTVHAGATVDLDGSGSTDVDGDTLTYAWSFTSIPEGSTAVLTNPTTVTPSFNADKLGSYVVQLIVNDGHVDSAPVTVTITTQNSAPIANPGPPRTVHAGTTVNLSGAGSSDSDSDPLTYAWSLASKPTGSAADIVNPTSVAPSFVADRIGSYVIQLIVHDGYVASAPASVTITTDNSAPSANAGATQTVALGSLVTLDGSASTDPDSDPLTYTWSIITKPAGSTAAPSDPAAVNPTFTADRPGSYVAQLIVNDGWVNSAPATVLIKTQNSAPVAIAGTDQTVIVGATVTLNGGGSSDADGDSITYAWSITSAPVGSTASLTNPNTVNPSFAPDLMGAYVISLIVNDGTVDSAPDTVTVNASYGDISLSLVNSNLIGVGRGAVLRATLSNPAPPGGVTITVSSDDAGTVSVAAPGTVAVAEGATTGDVVLNGAAAGGTTLRGNAPGYTEGTLSVAVTLNLISMPATLNAAFGQTASLPMTIGPNPAAAGGVTIDLVSSDPAVIEVVTPSVTVPEGQLSVNATVRGLLPGTATISASNPAYSGASTQVSASANLNITDASITFNSGFPKNMTIQLESAGTTVPAPAGGLAVTLTAADPACVSVTSTLTIGAGLLSAATPLNYGDSATLPCTTTVTAAAPNTTPDTVSVTVNPAPGITIPNLPASTKIGSGLQMWGFIGRLGTATHDPVTLRIESSDPSIALVASGSATAGTPFIEKTLLNGETDFTFAIQGVEGATGPVTITASATGFNNGTASATIVQPAVEIEPSSLAASIASLAASDRFYVQVGIPNAGNTAMQQNQNVRYGGPPLVVTVTNSEAAFAQLKTTAGADQTRTVVIPAGYDYSPDSGTTWIEFDPIAPGSTTVSASAPGFIALPAASRSVTVTAPAITLGGCCSWPVRVGAGLVSGYASAWLGGANHGGATVRFESSDPSIALVSANASTPGTSYVDVTVPNGNTRVDFYIHGVVQGDATVTASEPRFTSVTGTVNVVQSALEITWLPATMTSLSPNANFYVEIGALNALGTGRVAQNPRPGTTIEVTVQNSNAAVAQLVTSGSPGQSRTVQIPAGDASVSVAFDPLGPGTTTVSASIPGFFQLPSAAGTSVTVTASSIALQGFPKKVGAGLVNFSQYIARLGGSSHGGVTVRIRSNNPSVALVSASSSTPGAEFIDIPVTNGNADANFYVHGVAIGATTITASQALFTDGTGAVTVVQPAVGTQYLGTATTSLSASDDFNVYIGIPNAGLTNFDEYQAPRPGVPLILTVTSSNPSVGQLVTSAGAGASRDLQMPLGYYYNQIVPIAFDPIANGSTTVSVSGPGFIQLPSASTTVTVTSPGITINATGNNIGAGLQRSFTVTLGASAHGGVTVRVQSSNAGVAVVAPNATTAGGEWWDFPIADGSTQATFFVQAVPGATGPINITATAPGFMAGSGSVTVIRPAVRISNLPRSTTAGHANISFDIYCGAPNATYTQIVEWQPAGPAGLAVTITNSNADAAQLVTALGAGQIRSITIAPGYYYTQGSAAQNRVEFDPLAPGLTTVTASSAESVPIPASSVTVNVTP